MKKNICMSIMMGWYIFKSNFLGTIIKHLTLPLIAVKALRYILAKKKMNSPKFNIFNKIFIPVNKKCTKSIEYIAIDSFYFLLLNLYIFLM